MVQTPPQLSRRALYLGWPAADGLALSGREQGRWAVPVADLTFIVPGLIGWHRHADIVDFQLAVWAPWPRVETPDLSELSFPFRIYVHVERLGPTARWTSRAPIASIDGAGKHPYARTATIRVSKVACVQAEPRSTRSATQVVAASEEQAYHRKRQEREGEMISPRRWTAPAATLMLALSACATQPSPSTSGSAPPSSPTAAASPTATPIARQRVEPVGVFNLQTPANGASVVGGEIWLSNHWAGTVVVVDPATNRRGKLNVVDREHWELQDVGWMGRSFAVTETGIWGLVGIDDGPRTWPTVVRIDPATLATQRCYRQDHPLYWAVGDALWIADGQSLREVDPRTCALQREREGLLLLQGFRSFQAGAGSLWAAGDRGIVQRIDPESLEVIAEIEGPDVIAAGEDQVWAASTSQGVVAQVDVATNQLGPWVVVHSAAQTGDVMELTVVEDGVWVHGTGGQLTFVDAASHQVREAYDVPNARFPGHIAEAFGSLWIPLWDYEGEFGTVWRVDHPG
jgi:hypothetical protein